MSIIVHSHRTQVVILALAQDSFFHLIIPFSNSFLISHYSLDNTHYYPWLKGGGSVDIHLKCSTHVGENWGAKMIEQRRFTDDRLGWFLQSLDIDYDVISAHCNLATIAQSQAAGITWHNFLSPYSHMTFFFEVPKKFSNNVCVLLHWLYTLRQFLLIAPVFHQHTH